MILVLIFISIALVANCVSVYFNVKTKRALRRIEHTHG